MFNSINIAHPKRSLQFDFFFMTFGETQFENIRNIITATLVMIITQQLHCVVQLVPSYKVI